MVGRQMYSLVMLAVKTAESWENLEFWPADKRKLGLKVVLGAKF